MESLIITIVQSDIIWGDPEKNIDKYEKKLSNIEKTNLVVLPEMFTSGFTTNPSSKIIDSSSFSVEWMKKMAKKLNCAICGSLIVQEDNTLKNRFYFITNEEDIYYYDKKHLFSFASEDEFFSPGNKNVIIPYKGINIKPQICYDLRFPIWNKNSYDKKNDSFEYDVLIYVANWPEKRILNWKHLLIARAIENQSYVIGVNRVGVENEKVSYSGKSMIIGPSGEIIFEAPDNIEAIETVELDLKKLKEHRKHFPFALDWDKFIIK